ncbi:MAG: nucleotide sugar dehydrogenase [Deltaproteobacteria bacterium]|nr:nucleotide sugar dehydrogenase [Deltaproteobacteria bacterium]
MTTVYDVDLLMQQIESREALVGICGLGYVGLPLVQAFYNAGFSIMGFDIDQAKVDKLMAGESYIKHLDFSRFSKAIAEGRFMPTTDFTKIRQPDVLLVAVPTPLDHNREPDLGPVRDTSEAIATGLRRGQLVILESTTYPGTTEEVMKPILEKTGLRAESDFFLAYSPEREDPGNPKFETRTIPKVVGGHGPASLRVAVAVYSAIIDRVVAVSSMGAAEMAKILENTFRAVNIALVNELKLLCNRMGIDVWEVIDAAATKPFGFMPFYPGPGLGGHCIPIDPFYLTWKAREYDFTTRFIELAGEINTNMPYSVIDGLVYAMSEKRVPLNGSKVLVLGVAYKKNVDDMRESPALKIIDLLQKFDVDVSYHDPFILRIPRTRKYDLGLGSVTLTAEHIASHDCVLILTDHDSVDYELVSQHAKLIVDTRNAMKRVARKDNVRKV